MVWAGMVELLAPLLASRSSLPTRGSWQWWQWCVASCGSPGCCFVVLTCRCCRPGPPPERRMPRVCSIASVLSSPIPFACIPSKPDGLLTASPLRPPASGSASSAVRPDARHTRPRRTGRQGAGHETAPQTPDYLGETVETGARLTPHITIVVHGILVLFFRSKKLH